MFGGPTLRLLCYVLIWEVAGASRRAPSCPEAEVPAAGLAPCDRVSETTICGGARLASRGARVTSRVLPSLAF